MHLEQVTLVESSDRGLRLRVTDPLVYPAYLPFDLVFEEVASFTGEQELDTVSLRISDHGDDQRKFEFVGESILPTSGRPYQSQIRQDGSSSVLYGERRELVLTCVVARSLVITSTADS